VSSEDAEFRKVQVDFDGLMEVVGRNLYSTPLVAVRELVQNAHDSCVRRELEGAGDDYAPRITVRLTGAVLEIEDRGAGLTRQEILDYLATIGSGMTRKLRASHADADLIGAFGLGFLSTYVLSDQVEVITTSHREPERGWRFVSKTGESFSLQPVEARPEPGTLVRLELKDAFSELARPETLAAVLDTYCCLLPVPVELVGVGVINDAPAPWLLDEVAVGALAARKARLEFAARFEARFTPLTAFAIPPSDDGAVRGGLIWLQDGWSYASSDNRSVSVFVRGMLITRDERDLLPPWAGFVGAIVDSRELTPTASREELVRDAAYERARDHVRESLIAGLEAMERREPAAWRRALRRHNEAMLGAAVSDPRLFDLLSDRLTVPTSEGDLTMREVARGSERIHVSTSERGGPDEVLFRALQRPIVNGARFAAYPFAREYCGRHRLELVELGTQQGNARLFPPEALPLEQARRLEALLGEEGVEIVATRFSPPSLPVVLAYDQEVKLKERVEADEADRRMSSAILSLARLHTETIDATVRARLYVNLDNPIVALLLSGQGEATGTQRDVASVLWGLARLMAPSEERSGALEHALEGLGVGLLALIPH
jgi:molecular chaperone HtpG